MCSVFVNTGGVSREILDRLIQLIEGSELSQAQLAKELGKVRSTVSEWKSGRSEPGMATIAKLCERENVSADWLFALRDEKDPVPVSAVKEVERLRIELDDAQATLRGVLELVRRTPSGVDE